MGNTFLASLLIIFHFLTTTSSMKLTSIITDQSALLTLKHNVLHDPQNILTNWSVSTPVCSWFGISCGSKHRRVTAVNLHGLGLIGTLPPHLGNMSFLSVFSVSSNHFHGRLPGELSDLRRLKHIQFGNNSFDGEIPSWIGSLTQLRSLNLSHNNFQGAIPFSLGNLPKLEILSLFGNRISGPIPSSIFDISSLQKVNLRNNNLSGSIPSVSLYLFALKFIEFSYNNIVGHISEDMFDHTPKLTWLALCKNHISGTIPSSLFKCKELEYLALSHNHLEGSLAVEIGNLSMLQVVLIGENHFEGNVYSPLFQSMRTFYYPINTGENILCTYVENFVFYKHV